MSSQLTAVPTASGNGLSPPLSWAAVPTVPATVVLGHGSDSRVGPAVGPTLPVSWGSHMEEVSVQFPQRLTVWV